MENKDTLHGNTFWDWIREEPDHVPVDIELECNQKMIREHIVFFGQVQGVGFRYVLMEAASIFDLTGTAKNMPDMTVEAYLQGRPIDIINAVGFTQLLSKYIIIDEIKHETVETINEDKEFITF